MKGKNKSREDGNKVESDRLTRKDYEKALEKLHIELVKAQRLEEWNGARRWIR